MSAYMTKQRKALLDFLYNHHDEVFSTLQIAKALEAEKISQSAIYRNLTALESENKVRRHIRKGTNEVYYQYINPDICKGKIHLNCKNCSSSFHMNVTDADKMVQNMLMNDDFEVDKDITVIYGICKNCKDKKTRMESND